VTATRVRDQFAHVFSYREKMDGCYACSVRRKKRVRDEAMGVQPRFGGCA
jgi:hypothetical protein